MSRKGELKRGRKPKAPSPSVEPTRVLPGKAYRWKGHQLENAKFLREKKLSWPAIADILMIPLGSLREAVPEKKRYIRKRVKPYIPEEWRERTK